MDNGKATVCGLSSTVCFVGVVARVESLYFPQSEIYMQVDELFDKKVTDSCD
jgi:hypothetical protein